MSAPPSINPSFAFAFILLFVAIVTISFGAKFKSFSFEFRHSQSHERIYDKLYLKYLLMVISFWRARCLMSKSTLNERNSLSPKCNARKWHELQLICVEQKHSSNAIKLKIDHSLDSRQVKFVPFCAQWRPATGHPNDSFSCLLSFVENGIFLWIYY